LSRVDISQSELAKNLRERLIVTDLLKKDPTFLKQQRNRFYNRVRLVFTVFAIGLTLVAAVLFIGYNLELSTYSVDYEETISGMKDGNTFAFKNGYILIGADSVSFLKSNEIQWTSPISLKTPQAVQEGNYFSLFDIGGSIFYIFDETGLLSTTRMSRDICDIDIAKNGVTAVFSASDDAAYISYFDKFGTKIDVEIKTILSATGYPVDMAISPNGQELLVLYYSIGNGVGESTLYFYDFENGSASSDFLIKTYHDYYETDTFLASCEFFDDNRAVAIGDNSMSFFSYHRKDGLSRNIVSYEGEAQSFVYGEKYLSVVLKKNGENVLTQYSEEGEKRYAFLVPASYDLLISNENFTFFFDEKDIYVYNNTGRLRYKGTLVTAPVSVSSVSGTTIVMNNGSKISKLTFK